MSTKKIATLGILCALAMIVNLFRIPLVPAVAFLQYDPKDVIIAAGGFMYGTLSAFLMSVVCSILELYRGGTLWDVVMNVISTCAFACVAAAVYQKKKTRKGAILGLGLGLVCNLVCMLIWNYIVDPIYFVMERSAVVAMLPAIGLFNILKCGLNAGILLMTYKTLSSIFSSRRLKERNDEGKPHSGMLLLGGFLILTVIFTALAMNGLI